MRPLARGTGGAIKASAGSISSPLRPVEFHVLLALADSDRHGYAILHHALRQSRAALQVDAGTLYRTLHRMVRNGLVEERRDGRPPGADKRRRYYRLTAHGRRAAAREANRMAGLVVSARAKGLLGKG